MLPTAFTTHFARHGWYVHRANDLPLTQFQVLGERGSGTNLVRWILQQNIELFRTEGLGWKHGFPHMAAIPADMLIVCVVRNAVSWARSMHKRPWHAHPSLHTLAFSDFIRAPWCSIVDRPSDFEELHPEIAPHVTGAELQFDRHPITGEGFANLFELRKVKQAALLGMLNRGCNVMMVKAELAQVAQPDLVAIAIEELGLSLRGMKIKKVKERLGNRFNRSVEIPTPSELSPEDHAFMLGELDLETETALGYRYEA